MASRRPTSSSDAIEKPETAQSQSERARPAAIAVAGGYSTFTAERLQMWRSFTSSGGSSAAQAQKTDQRRHREGHGQ